MENIRVSKDGYNSLERELVSLQERLTKVSKYKNKIAVENGDVWHDNNDFEQMEIEERRLIREIFEIKEKIKNAEIIEEQSEFGKVYFGSIVTLIISGSDFSETETIIFSDSDEESIYYKVSANSPIGKAIFNQPVGYMGKYEVNGNKMKVEIINIK